MQGLTPTLAVPPGGGPCLPPPDTRTSESHWRHTGQAE
ncbi:hypothetical protein SBRY_10829 [Actinacidiphila bryophytorum]|uniref:Uncharacterized protein n=1 Tax=Actinacidiphila bryophytorum TaxID=1436133 RepID=A0A9W4GZ02_9ACTN|nr:hypothetical protein SBRY_10829 [Actinacidiphila bryophytorum]